MKTDQYTWAIGAVAALLFLPFLGGLHLFDWDEINFAECAREMIVSGDYLRVQIAFQPFHEKPPLFIWFQVLAMLLFGIGEYAARFPNAICGILTLLTLYHLGSRHQDRTFGLWWALAYGGSVLPHFYFKSGIIDPWFNYFIFLSLYFFVRYVWVREGLEGGSRQKWLLLSGGLMSLALLTKGPAALLIFGLCVGVYTILDNYRRYREQGRLTFRLPVSPVSVVVFTLVALSAMLLWYGVDAFTSGSWQLMQEFTVYQYRLFSTPDAGHAGFFGYHFVVLLLGCFPASIFAIRAMWPDAQQPDARQRDLRLWMLILFWVVLILFSIVKSKIVHYSSLCYFPLTYLAALALRQIQQGTMRLSLPMRVGLALIASVLALVLLVLPWLAQYPELVQPLLSKDPFAQANLNARPNWTGWESVAGLVFLLACVWALRLMATTEQVAKGMAVVFIATIFALQSVFFLYIAKIEQYSQRAAIEFFKGIADKECYFWTFGYKSYAQLFYARMTPDDRPPVPFEEWERYLLTGPTDRDAYFSMKITSEKDLKGENLVRLGERNGFVFYMRPGKMKSEE